MKIEVEAMDTILASVAKDLKDKITGENEISKLFAEFSVSEILKWIGGERYICP